MHKFIHKDGTWSTHKSVEFGNEESLEVKSIHVLHDSRILVASCQEFIFYNQELEHVTDIDYKHLFDGYDYVISF